MKKETIVTTTIGIIMGVIVALIVISNIKEKKVERKKVIVLQITPVVSIKISPEKELFLTIENPVNGFITEQDTVKITGRTDKEALIVIQSPFAEKIVRDVKQNFTVEFPLFPGQNVIKITSYIGENMREKMLSVYSLKEN